MDTDIGLPAKLTALVTYLRRDPGHAELLWDPWSARDHYKTYLRVRRDTNNYAFTICNRLPFQEVTLMDSIRLREAAGHATCISEPPHRRRRWHGQIRKHGIPSTAIAPGFAAGEVREGATPSARGMAGALHCPSVRNLGTEVNPPARTEQYPETGVYSCERVEPWIPHAGGHGSRHAAEPPGTNPRHLFCLNSVLANAFTSLSVTSALHRIWSWLTFDFTYRAVFLRSIVKDSL